MVTRKRKSSKKNQLDFGNKATELLFGFIIFRFLLISLNQPILKLISLRFLCTYKNFSKKENPLYPE